jgi:hypothetical protein
MHFEVWATPRGLLFGHSGERVENALGTSWEQFGNDLRMLREHSRMHWEPTENALGTFWERIGNAEAIGLMFFIIIILQKKYNSILHSNTSYYTTSNIPCIILHHTYSILYSIHGLCNEPMLNLLREHSRFILSYPPLPWQWLWDNSQGQTTMGTLVPFENIAKCW